MDLISNRISARVCGFKEICHPSTQETFTVYEIQVTCKDNHGPSRPWSVYRRCVNRYARGLLA